MSSQFKYNNLKYDLDNIYIKAKNINIDVQNNHLQKMINITNFFRLLGILTMWYCINPISIISLTLYTTAKWTMIGHHSCHGGYDNINKKHHRLVFGIKQRRFWDWFDWFLPEAWNYEHNNKHHYYLGEANEDPDLIEHNIAFLREAKIPLILKYINVLILASTWRWSYYASNTYKELAIKNYENKTNENVKKERYYLIYTAFIDKNKWFSFYEFYVKIIGTYLIYNFLLLPSPLLLFSYNYFCNSIYNLIISEFLTNFYTFLIIATNHAGSDVYRFSTKCDLQNKEEFYLRQIIGSVNFNYGNDFIDYLHGFLNYQIEHHVFPDLSMYAYQQIAPEVKAICKKNNIPYIQENVFIRLYKTIKIFTGEESMKVL